MKNPNAERGLDQAAVLQRQESGLTNAAMKPLTRSVGQIIRQNSFTLFNFVNLAIGALIFTTGQYANLLFLGVAIVNTAIGSIQEIQAKHQIDSLAILAETPVTVIREGTAQKIPSSDIVLDDVLVVMRGDQLPVDGHVLTSNGLEVDESPLTGESQAIVKHTDDELFSGSFAMAGRATMHVTAVGPATFAAKLALEAKSEKVSQSVLLATINRIIRVLTYTLIPLGLALFFAATWRHTPYNRAILSTSAAVIGMIPEGLVLLTNVALAVSAQHLAARKILVRALPAIEALARVDVICLDKTGTITSGQLKVTEAHPAAGHTEQELVELAAGITYALNDDNETALAVKQYAAQPSDLSTVATVPFSSARKWSGVHFSDGRQAVMGANEFIFKDHPLAPDIEQTISTKMNSGMRILTVATVSSLDPLRNPELIGYLEIADEVRPTAKNTFDFFAKQDVQLKVISGDNPETVASVARRAGLVVAETPVDMTQVPDNADFGELATTHTVFGRVTPTQKKRLIEGLQAHNHTVAMTGDGVNDVLALRQSDCGIAMASGSEAAQSIADFVLLDSNFDAMTGVLNEGRRVINNIERVAAMYLVKTIFSVILTALFIFIPLNYPITPINLTPISAVCVAIPSFFLTLEPNFKRVQGYFMQKVMTIATPAAIGISLYAIILIVLEAFMGLDFDTTSTLVAAAIAAFEFQVLFKVSLPLNRYKIVLLTLVLAAVILIFFVLNRFFSLVSLWTLGHFLLFAGIWVSSLPFYLILQDLFGNRIFDKINWR